MLRNACRSYGRSLKPLLWCSQEGLPSISLVAQRRRLLQKQSQSGPYKRIVSITIEGWLSFPGRYSGNALRPWMPWAVDNPRLLLESRPQSKNQQARNSQPQTEKSSGCRQKRNLPRVGYKLSCNRQPMKPHDGSDHGTPISACSARAKCSKDKPKRPPDFGITAMEMACCLYSLAPL